MFINQKYVGLTNQISYGQKEIETICPKNQAEWRQWLEKNHLEKDAVWLIAYRKSSGISSVVWEETVDVALCYGWIDSVQTVESLFTDFTDLKDGGLCRSSFANLYKKDIFEGCNPGSAHKRYKPH